MSSRDSSSHFSSGSCDQLPHTPPVQSLVHPFLTLKTLTNTNGMAGSTHGQHIGGSEACRHAESSQQTHMKFEKQECALKQQVATAG
eukprot:1152751-Pelagomonas_calceolata.AAC.3